MPGDESFQAAAANADWKAAPGFGISLTNQAGAKATTSVPTGWTTSNTCWVARKDGSC